MLGENLRAKGLDMLPGFHWLADHFAQDSLVLPRAANQEMLNYIDRLSMVKADPKCTCAGEPIQGNGTESATPRGSNGSRARGEGASFTVQGQLRALRALLFKHLEIDVGAGHRLMGRMPRHGRTADTTTRSRGVR